MFCQDIIPASASTFPLNYVFLFSPQLLAVFSPPWFNKYNICFNKGEVYGYFKYIIWRSAHFSLCQATRYRNPEQKYPLPGHGQPNQKPSGEIQWFQEPRLSWAYLAVIHRLDQPVAGILVFAKTPAAAKDLNKQLQNQGFGKYYRALVANTPSTKEGTLENYMVKDARTNTSRICLRRKTDQKLHGCIMIQFLLRTGCLPHLLLSTELSWKSIWIPAAIIRSVYNSHLSVVRLLEIPNIIRNFLTPRAGRQSGCVLIN